MTKNVHGSASDQADWDIFLSKCGGRESLLGLISEMFRLQKSNLVARREIERIVSVFDEQSGITKPTSWAVGSLGGITTLFGGGSDELANPV